MTIEFKRFPCSKCGGTKMMIDKQRCFTGFRYRLYCDNCRSFVQWANPEQKMIINAIFEAKERRENDKNHLSNTLSKH